MTKVQKIVFELVGGLRDFDMLSMSEMTGYADDELEEVYEDVKLELNDLYVFMRDDYFNYNP